MNGKVLIIGPDYFNFLSAAASAFGRLGWQTAVESYDNPIHPYNACMRVRYRFSRHKDELQKVSRCAYNSYILNRFNEIRPDAVFIMNGDILETDTLDAFRKSAKVAVWLFDSRTKLPQSIGHIDHVDAMFCFEQDDVNWYASQGKTAYFLPQACDTDTYRPLGLMRDIDVLFVGNLFYSPRRQKVMHEVVEAFPDRIVRVYGLYKPWFKNFWKWLTREKRRVYKNRNVSPAVACELYNRAKIAVNIHQEHQKNGANPRTFEICGTGAYQLCDGNPYIESLFQHGEVGIWHDTDELVSLIRKALSADMKADAQAAYELVQKEHTFDVRMKTVLDTLFR